MICLVFEDKGQAQIALDFVSKYAGYPRVGVNAATGQPEPGKQRTEKWAELRQRLTDEKWFFPKVPPEKLAGIPDEVIQQFYDSFDFTEEEYERSWIKEEGQTR